MRKSVPFMLSILFLFGSCSLSRFGWRVEDDRESGAATEKGIVEDWDPFSLEEKEIDLSLLDTPAESVPKTGPSPAKPSA
ncbi:MAG TPA: hypothetical protein ENN17_10105, partial [bacterium]|nr:hypothetical protein [bacterium]